MAIHSGSDTIICFGTYTAPSTTGWGTLSGCKILPFETSNAVNRNVESEDLKYKAGLNISLADGRSTVTETVINNVSYEITGSTYVHEGALPTGSAAVSLDMLRTMADKGDKHTIAIIHRPATIATPAPTAVDDLVALWCGSAGPDIVMDSVISSFSETEEVATHVKCDITFKQAGEIIFRKETTWA